MSTGLVVPSIAESPADSPTPGLLRCYARDEHPIQADIDKKTTKFIQSVEKLGGVVAGSFAAWAASPAEWESHEPDDIDIFTFNKISANTLAFVLTKREQKEHKFGVAERFWSNTYSDKKFFVQSFSIPSLCPTKIQVIYAPGYAVNSLLNDFYFIVSQAYLSIKDKKVITSLDWEEHQKTKQINFAQAKEISFNYYMKYILKGYIPKTANDVVSTITNCTELNEVSPQVPSSMSLQINNGHTTPIYTKSDVIRDYMCTVYGLLQNTKFTQLEELKTLMSLL